MRRARQMLTTARLSVSNPSWAVAPTEKSARKLRVLTWQRQSESLAEQPNVLTIPFVDFVAGMKLDKPRWIDATHWRSGNDPNPCQVLSGVRQTACVFSRGIKRV
jgi:hypothetical protein